MSGSAIEAPEKSPRSTWRLLLYLLVVVLVFSCGVVVTKIGVSTDLSNLNADDNALVFDRHGLQLGLFHPEINMAPVALEAMAPILIDAVLVSLDPDYLLTRKTETWPLLEPILTGNFVNDQTSVTQLYLRLDDEAPTSRWRALQEASKVIQLERTYPREALLEQYLSRVPLGRNAFGVEAASINWFGVSAKDLEIGQAAYLASQIAKRNQSLHLESSAFTILTRLHEEGMVTDQEYLHHGEILREGLRFNDDLGTPIKETVSDIGLMPALEQIYEELSEYYGKEPVIKGNIGVISTIDLGLQSRIAEIAEEEASSSLARQAAVVVLDDRNQVRATYRTGGLPVEDIRLGSWTDIAWSSDLMEIGFASETSQISLVQLAELHSVLARKGIKFRTHSVLETVDNSGEQVDRFSQEEVEIFDTRRISDLSEGRDNLSTIDRKIGKSDEQTQVQGNQGVDVELGVTWYGGSTRRFAVALWISTSPGDLTANSSEATRFAGRIFSELHRDG